MKLGDAPSDIIYSVSALRSLESHPIDNRTWASFKSQATAALSGRDLNAMATQHSAEISASQSARPASYSYGAIPRVSMRSSGQCGKEFPEQSCANGGYGAPSFEVRKAGYGRPLPMIPTVVQR